MQRMIDIEEKGGRLSIRFPYAEGLVAKVRTLPGRRWDRHAKTWYVPFKHLDHVLAKLANEHFKVSAALRAYCEELGQPVEMRLAEAGAGQQLPEGTVTVSELNARAKRAIREAFGEELWIVGEVQSYERNAPGRHAYFEIVERLAEGEDPVAKLRAVMFVEDRRDVEAALEASPASVRLRDGLQVRVRVKVDLYAPHGSYQVIVRAVDASYTTGKIHENRERIVSELRREGISEKNLGRPWPACPLRVGLITSAGSDAYRDFVEELRRSGYGFEVSVHHANVQGNRTESSVLRALARFEGRADELDIVVVVRGGGSRSDLAYFDTEAIGRAVCEHPTKMLVGVGHQRDRCLLDMIAVSAKTPTAAAGMLVERVRGYMERMEGVGAAVFEGARRRVEDAMHGLLGRSVRLERSVDGRLRVEQRRLNQLTSRVTLRAHDGLAGAGQRVESLAERVPERAKRRLERADRGLGWARRRLRQDRFTRRLSAHGARLVQSEKQLGRAARAVLERRDRQLGAAADRVRLLDPQRVLERGYAMVEVDGVPAMRVRDVAPGRVFDVRMSDGVLRARREESDSIDEE